MNISKGNFMCFAHGINFSKHKISINWVSYLFASHIKWHFTCI